MSERHKASRVRFVCMLADDASTREKLEVMSKFEAMLDDSRNTGVPGDLADQIDEHLEPGKFYRVTIQIEEITAGEFEREVGQGEPKD